MFRRENMKVIIISDLEGISCVDDIDMIFVDEEYQKARKLLMEDVNATISGAFEGGASEVYVLDGHGGGNNFIPELLDKRAKQIKFADFNCFECDEYDAAITMGCHAMAGTTEAFLDHTQSSSTWFDYKVNGKSYGEIGQQAITFGAHSVPLVMVSGDLAACNEAKSLIPNIATAIVKSAKIRNKAECLPLEEALKKISDAAADGVRRYKEIKPYKIETPADISLTLYRNDYCDDIVKNNANLQRNGRTVSKTVDTIKCHKDILF